jgi:excinuclease ABC subunit B
MRIEFFGDEIDRITRFDPRPDTPSISSTTFSLPPSGETPVTPLDRCKRFENDPEELTRALVNSVAQPAARGATAQRYGMDLEMVQEMGFCNGRQNFRATGVPGQTLCFFDFSRDFLLIVDESHVHSANRRGIEGSPAKSVLVGLDCRPC